MKHYIIIIAVLVISATSCKKDFLTKYPEGSINVGNFYKTAGDFQEALTGAYVPLRDAANNGFYIEEMRADNAYYTYNPKDRGSVAAEHIADFLDDVSDGVPGTTWIAGFNGINRCNMILDQLQDAAGPVDEAPQQLPRIYAGVRTALVEPALEAGGVLGRRQPDEGEKVSALEMRARRLEGVPSFQVDQRRRGIREGAVGIGLGADPLGLDEDGPT